MIFFFFFSFKFTPAGCGSSGPTQLFPAHSFPGKCLHRERPSWEAHLSSERRVWRTGRAKSGPSLFCLLLLPVWETSLRPCCRVPVTSSIPSTSGYPSWHGPHQTNSELQTPLPTAWARGPVLEVDVLGRKSQCFPLLKGLRSALPGDLRAERLTLPAQVWGPSGSWEGTSAFNPSTLAVGAKVTKGLPEAAVLRC